MKLSLRLKKHVPIWVLLVVILAAGGVISGLIFLPRILNPPSDFTVSANPIIANPHNGGVTALNFTSVRGFVGIVSIGILASTHLTSGFSTCDCSSTTIVLGPTATIGVHVQPDSTGNYTLRLIASSGSLSHQFNIPVTSQDLKMAFSPTTASVAQGSQTSTSVTLAGVNHLSGTVSFSISLAPSDRCGILCPIVTAATQQVALSPDKPGILNFAISVGIFTGGTWYYFVNAYVCCLNSFSIGDVYILNAISASENLTAPAYQFQSNTNVTLSLKNSGPFDDQLRSYQINDTMGHSYFWNYFCSQYGCPGPYLPANATTQANFILNNYVPANFTFVKGQTYTIAVTTTRVNLFVFNVTYR